MDDKTRLHFIDKERFRANRRPILLIILYLIFEYGRPQAFLPAIGIVRPAMIIQLLMIYYVLPVLMSLRFQKSQTKAMFLFVLIMLPHVPLAHNTYWAFNTLKIMFLYFIIHLTILTYVKDYKSIVKIVNIWLFIILVGGIIGIIHGGRIPGSSIMGDENDFSLVMIMALPLAFFRGLEADNQKTKLYYFGAVGIFVFATVVSFSRGGFVGLVTVGFYCWLKTPKKLISSLIIGVFIIIIGLAAPQKYWNEVKSIKEENIEEGTGATRWYTWKCGWRMFLDNPILGVGQGNFPWNFERYEPPEGYKGRLHGGRAAHSLYFTLLPELGIVGTVLFIFIAFTIMKESKYYILNLDYMEYKKTSNFNEEQFKRIKKIKYIILGLRGTMIGYLTSGVFLSVLYYPHFWLIMTIFLCVFTWCERQSTDQENAYNLLDSTTMVETS